MSDNLDDIYRNRDVMLGEIHQSAKNTEKSIGDITEWCKEHDKKDDKRFLYVCVAIIIIAAGTGILPQLVSLITK